ncbi:uncharacterized protein SCODWIG_00331 [Saccharomycodes ludwigii]|uniref:PITH domain-containing protein n=1 Tax=Saccharomycodes ludwigii TaxID=36035 RepID=A0A376B363_9ASCO|nr:hypothetical protein SCDLUD_001450 [Saccharomycodes ludwigii]KAH3901679.1 hypothetical protein SCDLUD_001450 [Saccharomycodes ludwigii]SSD58570.1 uncharacterized protein SCODWIG_00331 [Saccharomycodes ludwigii]
MSNCCCEHEHNEPPPIATYPNQSLYECMDLNKIKILNGVYKNGEKNYKNFIKTQESKDDNSCFLESDCDCQLVIHIPFTKSVKLYSMILRSAFNDQDDNLGSLHHVHLYKNFNKNIDFDTLENAKITYSIEHIRNNNGSEDVEHYLPRHQFQSVDSLTIFIPDNYEEDEDLLSRIYYLELRGDLSVNSGDKRQEFHLKSSVFESAPNPLDHVKLQEEPGSSNMIQ